MSIIKPVEVPGTEGGGRVSMTKPDEVPGTEGGGRVSITSVSEEVSTAKTSVGTGLAEVTNTSLLLTAVARAKTAGVEALAAVVWGR